MPKIAYLILAHQNPNHLRRLLNALQSDHSSCHVHLDAKAITHEFSWLGDMATKNRYKVYWGDFSQVEACLELIRTALDKNPAADYLCLLSGADYPLQSQTYIRSFLKNNAGAEFINTVAMPSEQAGKPLSRLEKYKKRPGRNPLETVPERIKLFIGMTPKTRSVHHHLGEIKPYGGSTWWCLTRQSAEHIIRFTEREKKIVRFFENTQCPDESFFHTIISNSRFSDRIKRNLTYTDWSQGGANPAVITMKHVQDLTAQSTSVVSDFYGPGEALFCRKFEDGSESLIELIKERRGFES